jgi:hypothetical protein
MASAADSLQQEGLDFIAVVFTGGDVIPDQSWTMQQHLNRLQGALDNALLMKPRFLNLLAGNDRWPMGQQVEFFGRAQELSDAAGVLCSFETHRASSLYSPLVTLELIARLPQLRFTADICHWIVVCERLLNDTQDDLRTFIDRVHHVQAGVGYDQGPQVPHPATPEYAGEVAFHQRLWEAVWASQRARGYNATTLTPEFGPDGYTHLLPFTKAPVADLWALNLHMAQTQRSHSHQWTKR